MFICIGVHIGLQGKLACFTMFIKLVNNKNKGSCFKIDSLADSHCLCSVHIHHIVYFRHECSIRVLKLIL